MITTQKMQNKIGEIDKWPKTHNLSLNIKNETTYINSGYNEKNFNLHT